MSRPGTRVADALGAVRERIAAAERRFDRAPGSVTLVAVAKTKPASLIRAAWEAGQRQFGENFVQEAVEKLDELSRLSGPGGVEWHFVGAIQANKSRTVAERFDWVQTVDRLRIARRLSDQRPAFLPPLNVCLQVNVSEESSKSGVRVEEAADLAAAVAELPRLRLRGLMAIPRPCTGFDEQRGALRPLVEVYERLRGDGFDLDTLSMGMTDDLEAAVAEGTTMVRIGTAVFGPRACSSPAPESSVLRRTRRLRGVFAGRPESPIIPTVRRDAERSMTGGRSPSSAGATWRRAWWAGSWRAVIRPRPSSCRNRWRRSAATSPSGSRWG